MLTKLHAARAPPILCTPSLQDVLLDELLTVQWPKHATQSTPRSRRLSAFPACFPATTAADQSKTKCPEFPHSDLLQDAIVGSPCLLEAEQSVTERLLGASQREGDLLGTSKPAREESAVVRAFRAKLRQVLFGRYIYICRGQA